MQFKILRMSQRKENGVAISEILVEKVLILKDTEMFFLIPCKVTIAFQCFIYYFISSRTYLHRKVLNCLKVSNKIYTSMTTRVVFIRTTKTRNSIPLCCPI